MTPEEVRHYDFTIQADELYQSAQWEGYLGLIQTMQPCHMSVAQLAQQAVAKLVLEDIAGAVSSHLATRHARHGIIHCTTQRTLSPAQLLCLPMKLCVICRLVCLRCR